MSVFSTSGVMLSIPGALLFFRFVIAFRISFFVGGEQSISRLSPKGCAIQARTADFGLLRSSLKCSAYLCSCLTSIVFLVEKGYDKIQQILRNRQAKTVPSTAPTKRNESKNATTSQYAMLKLRQILANQL